jgi:crossover junction endodeoxyribonuclease RuvC
MSESKVILGIDPGTTVMGYAILKIEYNKPALGIMDAIKLSGNKDIYARLEIIHRTVCSLISQYKPDTFAIEAPFFGKNVQSMLKLGRAQGVAIAAAMQAQISVTEYSPRKIKQSVTGNGNADKEQVWKMLQNILSLETKPNSFDATDALAVALCHHYQTSNPILGTEKPVKGWGDFMAKNPGRIIVK